MVLSRTATALSSRRLRTQWRKSLKLLFPTNANETAMVPYLFRMDLLTRRRLSKPRLRTLQFRLLRPSELNYSWPRPIVFQFSIIMFNMGQVNTGLFTLDLSNIIPSSILPVSLLLSRLLQFAMNHLRGLRLPWLSTLLTWNVSICPRILPQLSLIRPNIVRFSNLPFRIYPHTSFRCSRLRLSIPHFMISHLVLIFRTLTCLLRIQLPKTCLLRTSAKLGRIG